MNIGDTIKLKGITLRGKNRIATHGNTFVFKQKGLDCILVESLENTWRGEKWLGWFDLMEGRKEVEILK